MKADFMIPGAYVSGLNLPRDSATEPQTERSETPQPHLDGDVLIVEDNMIIALDAEEFAMELGARSTHVAAGVSDALAIIESVDLSFALLDVNLGTESSEAVAAELTIRSIPFAFATGYGDQTSLTQRFPTVPVIQKPYSKADIVNALTGMEGTRPGEPAA